MPAGPLPRAEDVIGLIRALPADELAKLIARLPKLTRELAPDSCLLHERELKPFMKFIEALITACGKAVEFMTATAERESHARGMFSLLKRMPTKEREKLLALVEHRTEWAVRSSTADQWMEQQLEEFQRIYDEDKDTLIGLIREARKSKAGPKKDTPRLDLLALAVVRHEQGMPWCRLLEWINDLAKRLGLDTYSNVENLRSVVSRVKKDPLFPERLGWARDYENSRSEPATVDE